MGETIQVRRSRGVEFLTLNRPEVRNAFNEHLIAEATAWASGLGDNPDVRAVVIEGAGLSFCAGADLAWMAKMAGYTRDENVRDARAAAALFAALDRLPVPVIARVHGAALGGGAGLVAVADIAIAADDAVFGFTEVKLGLIPAVIAPYALAKIGPSAARELFVTGRRFDAAHARTIGLVHEVVAADALDLAVGRYVDEVLANGREAMAAAKALLRRITPRAPEDIQAITAEAIAERRVGDEAQSRIGQFLRKSTVDSRQSTVDRPSRGS